MPGHRFPLKIVGPQEDVVFTFGLRTNGTYSECGMLMTLKRVYVIGNFIIKEDTERKARRNGLKIIKNLSLYDIKEKTYRNNLFLFFTFCFLSLLIYLSSGSADYYNIHQGLQNDYELILSLLTTCSFFCYVCLTKRFVVIKYQGGELRLRNYGMRLNKRDTLNNPLRLQNKEAKLDPSALIV